MEGVGFYPPLNQRTYVEDGIRVDQDVPVTLRDGAVVYVDIYRPDGPAGEVELPSILAWCWYGKRPGDSPNRDWQVFGVPPDTVSKMTKFEVQTRRTGADKGTLSSTPTAAEPATPRVG